MHRVWFEPHLTGVRLFEFSEVNLLQGRQAFSAALRGVNLKFCFSFILFLLLVPLGHTTESTVSSPHEYRLRFYHTHTGERLDVVYRRGDHYLPEALDELDHYLRDHRTGDVRHFDPRLFDLLYDLTASLGDSGGEIDVICGYRTPWSNEFLRTRNLTPAWRSTACICRPKRSTFAYVGFRRWSCAMRPCACIGEEWGTIIARTSCTSTSGACAIGSCLTLRNSDNSARGLCA